MRASEKRDVTLHKQHRLNFYKLEALEKIELSFKDRVNSIPDPTPLSIPEMS